MTEKTVVLRLVGGDYEGKWMVIPNEPLTASRQDDSERGYSTVQMVATGSVEWNGDQAAEVYVPADQLDLWRAEHEVDP